eukprot:223020-Rhodomonas_salina.2
MHIIHSRGKRGRSTASAPCLSTSSAGSWYHHTPAQYWSYNVMSAGSVPGTVRQVSTGDGVVIA